MIALPSKQLRDSRQTDLCVYNIAGVIDNLAHEAGLYVMELCRLNRRELSYKQGSTFPRTRSFRSPIA